MHGLPGLVTHLAERPELVGVEPDLVINGRPCRPGAWPTDLTDRECLQRDAQTVAAKVKIT